MSVFQGLMMEEKEKELQSKIKKLNDFVVLVKVGKFNLYLSAG